MARQGASSPPANHPIRTASSGGRTQVGVAHTRRVEKSSWLAFALNPFPDMFAIGPGGAAASTARVKIKDALLRRRHTDRQIAAMYHHLTRDDVSVAGGIGLATYGGRVN